MTTLLVPWPARSLPLTLVLGAAVFEFLRVWRLPPPPEALRLRSDGSFWVRRAGIELPAQLQSSSILGRDLALLAWRESGHQGRLCQVACMRRDNAATWSRALLIWRWAARRDRRHIRVDLPGFLQNFPRIRRSMVVTAGGPVTSKGARPHGLDIR
ncbi:MAG: hypothetical protein AAFS02_02990 [Pseudomonadota bacterium]